MENITEHIQKVKPWIVDNKSDLYVASLIFLVGLASFGLGRLSVLWPTKEPIQILNQEARIMNHGDIRETADISSPLDSKFMLHDSAATKGRYVASKSGTAYHFPWCPGAQRIKEENKVWFETKEAAEKAGYRPAGNCEGL